MRNSPRDVDPTVELALAQRSFNEWKEKKELTDKSYEAARRRLERARQAVMEEAA